MSLTLSNLKPNRSSARKRKRVGRGNASGHGTYSTRGLKGQKSRSGVSGLKRLGMKKQLLAIPKKRGFASYKDKAQVVLLSSLNKAFKDGANISPKTLASAGLIVNPSGPIKILNSGKLTLKNLVIEKVALSSTAKAAIEAAGGSFKA